MSKQPKRPRVPETYECANPQCTRTSKLLVDGYRVQRIPPETPSERIHRVVDTGINQFTLLCTCGHFTDVRPWRDEAEPRR